MDKCTWQEVHSGRMLNEKLLRERLRQVVDQSGLTRQKFAEAVGLSTTGLGNPTVPRGSTQQMPDFTGFPALFLGRRTGPFWAKPAP